MVWYAVAVGLFLGAAVVVVLLLHRALLAEDARYCEGITAEPAPPPAVEPTPPLNRAA
ncbi:MAG TPA: hypothetical protein VK066_18730 [Chloroflexota bacterium]|nr:hypothetical protein [Chloroflexota bacterium]